MYGVSSCSCESPTRNKIFVPVNEIVLFPTPHPTLDCPPVHHSSFLLNLPTSEPSVKRTGPSVVTLHSRLGEMGIITPNHPNGVPDGRL